MSHPDHFHRSIEFTRKVAALWLFPSSCGELQPSAFSCNAGAIRAEPIFFFYSRILFLFCFHEIFLRFFLATSERARTVYRACTECAWSVHEACMEIKTVDMCSCVVALVTKGGSLSVAEDSRTELSTFYILIGILKIHSIWGGC